MRKTVYKYQFEPEVPLEKAEATLMRAIIAAEALHGQAEVRLSMRHRFDNEKHTCVIDGNNYATRHVIMILTQYLIHELGEDAFQVELVSQEDRTERSANGKSTPDCAFPHCPAENGDVG